MVDILGVKISKGDLIATSTLSRVKSKVFKVEEVLKTCIRVSQYIEPYRMRIVSISKQDVENRAIKLTSEQVRLVNHEKFICSKYESYVSECRTKNKRPIQYSTWKKRNEKQNKLDILSVKIFEELSL